MVKRSKRTHSQEGNGKERNDIVRLMCVFENSTRNELHSMSKFLLTTKVPIAEESVEKTKEGIWKAFKRHAKMFSVALATFN